MTLLSSLSSVPSNWDGDVLVRAGRRSTATTADWLFNREHLGCLSTLAFWQWNSATTVTHGCRPLLASISNPWQTPPVPKNWKFFNLEIPKKILKILKRYLIVLGPVTQHLLLLLHLFSSLSALIFTDKMEETLVTSDTMFCIKEYLSKCNTEIPRFSIRRTYLHLMMLDQ